MAKPEYYDLLGIPSEEEERTRSVLSSGQPVGLDAYYNQFYQRGAPQQRGISGMPQRRVGVREWEQAQKKAAYEQNARRTLQQLTQIDPADPELTFKQEQLLMSNPYGQDLIRDPRVTSVLKNRLTERTALERQFQQDPDSQTDYLIARQEGADHRTALSQAAQAASQRKERLWFAEKGGSLEDFDSGQFSRNGRFDRAAAQAYINQMPPKKKAGDDKPWQERLTFKEGEAIRNAARAAKAGTFEDFDLEFTEQTTKKDAPFTGTRDEYVRKFKGEPDFNTYQQRRLMEVGQTLMDEYGLNAMEAAQVLGIRPQMPPDRAETPSGAQNTSIRSNSPTPTYDRIMGVDSSAEALASPTAVSTPAAAPTPAPPVASTTPYRTSSGRVKSIGESKQEEETTPEQQEQMKTQVQDFYNSKWTSAKDDLRKSLTERQGLEKLASDPDLILSLYKSIKLGEAVLPQDVGLPATTNAMGGLRPENPADLLARAIGKDPDAIATVSLPSGKKSDLMDSTGKKTWRQVIQALADEELINNKVIAAPNAPPPSGVAPSGSKWTVARRQ